MVDGLDEIAARNFDGQRIARVVLTRHTSAGSTMVASCSAKTGLLR